MKQMNVGIIGAIVDPSEGVSFDGRIIGDELVEFHFSCVGYLDREGRNFEISEEFADFDSVMNACDQDSELGIRLYNAFRSAVHNMLLGFHSQTWTANHVTIVTVEDDCTKLEVILANSEE